MDAAMRLVLTGRHVDITPGLRRLVDRKLDPLTRHLGDAVLSAQVKLTLDRTGHCADVTVHMRGDHMLNGRGAGATWMSALSTCTEKIQSQASRVKGRWDARRRRRPPEAEEATTPEPRASAATRTPRIVRLSRAQFKPMSVENAALELAQSGEPFVLFRNVDTDGLSVLVRQRGQFGLVEPGK
jgi:putative sigma-54 modulation protein